MLNERPHKPIALHPDAAIANITIPNTVCPLPLRFGCEALIEMEFMLRDASWKVSSNTGV